MQFRKKTTGPHKGQAFPIDVNSSVSSISKGPAPKGSVALKRNVKSFKVTIPEENAKITHSVPAKTMPEAKVHSPPSASGDVQTHKETHEE